MPFDLRTGRRSMTLYLILLLRQVTRKVFLWLSLYSQVNSIYDRSAATIEPAGRVSVLANARSEVFASVILAILGISRHDLTMCEVSPRFLWSGTWPKGKPSGRGQ